MRRSHSALNDIGSLSSDTLIADAEESCPWSAQGPSESRIDVVCASASYQGRGLVAQGFERVRQGSCDGAITGLEPAQRSLW